MNRGSQLAESANKFLEDKKVELAEAQAAYEVAIKKKKKGQEPPPAPNPEIISNFQWRFSRKCSKRDFLKKTAMLVQSLII